MLTISNLLNAFTDINVVYSLFVSGIISGLDRVSPKLQGPNKPRCPKTLSCPWWNEQCDLLIKDRQIALDAYKLSGNRQDFLEYKRKEACSDRA